MINPARTEPAVTGDPLPLAGRVALVAGATRGAGRALAVELARAGAHVYATGRSSSAAGPSEIGRPETIEETGGLITATGGTGQALVVDHEDPAQVAALIGRIEAERGRLDVLVNDIFGGDRYMEAEKPIWEHDLAGGLRMLRMGVDTHLVNCATALPLMLRGAGGLVIEVTDGTTTYNARFRRGVGFYYDLVKANVERIVLGLTAELAGHPVTALGVTPGWLRSEGMLDEFKVTEQTWREACAATPEFAISETPSYLARGVAALAADVLAAGQAAGSGPPAGLAGRILTARQLADRYGVTDADGSRPDCWGLLETPGADRADPATIARFR
jgi:NAD(P)-dependent dehydrogenase (short-subunit alcohol dehydrogenase family)